MLALPVQQLKRPSCSPKTFYIKSLFLNFPISLIILIVFFYLTIFASCANISYLSLFFISSPHLPKFIHNPKPPTAHISLLPSPPPAQMHQSKHTMSSKSLTQFPPFRYTPSHATPPHSSSASHNPSNHARDRVSISNLINSVDNTRITSLPSTVPPATTTAASFTSPSSHQHQQQFEHQNAPSSTSTNLLSSTVRDSARSRQRTSASTRVRAASAQGGRALQHSQVDDLTARRKKIQSEKKRLWRKNLSPDQKAKRQEMDAQRKREQRLNMTPEQRSEARRKDAARKAAKRRLQKEQMKGGTTSLSNDSGTNVTSTSSGVHRHTHPYSSSSSSSAAGPGGQGVVHQHRATGLSHFTDRSGPSGSFALKNIHDLLN